MTDVAAKYGLDFTAVRQVEALYGQRLPDLQEPLRLLDADLDTLQAQLDDYTAMAQRIERLRDDLSTAMTQIRWDGEAADQAHGFWDGVLTVLKWIAAVILLIVAVILLLIALLLIAIAETCRALGTVLSWVAAMIAVIVFLFATWRTMGRGQSGQLTMIWAALTQVFNIAYIAAMGTVGALCQGFGWLIDIAGRAVMWLSLYLMEVAAKLTDEPHDKLTQERDTLFG